MKATNTTVMSVLQYKKADLAVHQRTKYSNRESVFPSEKPILVIECKHHDKDNDSFSIDDEDQLVQYMTGAKFPNGLLLSEFKAQNFYRSVKSGEFKISRYEDGTFDIPKDISALVERIRSF